jgi:hypothetical protein
VIQPGIESGSAVTPLALRCSALDRCATREPYSMCVCKVCVCVYFTACVLVELNIVYMYEVLYLVVYEDGCVHRSLLPQLWWPVAKNPYTHTHTRWWY